MTLIGWIHAAICWVLYVLFAKYLIGLSTTIAIAYATAITTVLVLTRKAT